MTIGYFRGRTGVLALVAASIWQVQAQSPPAKSAANFSGVWLNRVQSPAFKGKQTEWTAEQLPFTAKGLQLFEANKPGKGPRQAPPAFSNDPLGTANPAGLYRTLIYFRPIEIIQLPDKIVQLYEWGKNWRTIYTDGRKVPDDVAAGPYWYGYSVGHSEGDTLVVNTLALDGRAWLDEWGLPMSDDMRVKERWQRIAPEKLQFTITVTDPTLYTRPWTSSPIALDLLHSDEPQEIISAPMDENSFNEQIRNPAGGATKK
jgi:hypothetical protein